MNYFFITGDSSGIGEALKRLVLNDQNNIVYGLSRRNRKEEERYFPIQLDLSNPEEISQFDFPELQDVDHIYLVNNAGQIGAIQPVFEQSLEEIAEVFQVNTIAVIQITSMFIQKYKSHSLKIINVSSGAALNPIQGWATYCSSKAALDMFSKTLIADLEFRELENVEVYSVSPGVVDTAMQKEIRSSKSENFSRLDQFQELKDNSELIDPHQTAALIYRIHENPSFFNSNFINLREFY
ncbi:MAG: SDR family NAD(P)-dependent oxidoreductase [Crocinitomicaceae bacterium]|nr:SDR family NAD(P)-dependent oxidoreductase [Crocinitomicaceae bacterium]